MDYKEQASYLKRRSRRQFEDTDGDAMYQAAQSIENLLSRAEAAEARCETLEKMVKEYQDELIPGYRDRAEKAERDAKEASQEAIFCRNGWKKSEIERDAAIRDLEDLMLCSVSGCDMCANAITVQREPCVRLDCALKDKQCTPKWRGAKEE